MHDFAQWMAGFPGLLFSVDIPHSRLYVHNRWAGQEFDASRLLKDAGYRRKIVRREDLALLMEFQDMMTARIPAAVTFMLADGKGPYIVQGWPDKNENCYHGLIKEAYLPAVYSTNGKAGTCQLDIGCIDYPVFVLDVPARKILLANEATCALFSFPGQGNTLPDFSGIASGELGDELLHAAGRALGSDSWGGTLSFSNAGGGQFSAHVRLTPCGGAGEGRVVRVALLNSPRTHSHVPAGAATKSEKNYPQTLREGLEMLYEMHAGDLDGLLFSDIQSQKGQVVVYGVGPAFRSLAWGTEHAYEGTIAQDIERFGLTSLTVEDTLDSIKSIDWVLFTPQGIRSYFARPFYGSSGLHAVLILASRRPGAFDTEAERLFASLYAPFEEVVSVWRSRASCQAEQGTALRNRV
ncbi:MAG: hypothetical protein Q3990_05030 [Desulfovibrionaceae bacterium]|nr:hypothetical protein [Desulfovibrionaceae bacterium]